MDKRWVRLYVTEGRKYPQLQSRGFTGKIPTRFTSFENTQKKNIFICLELPLKNI